MQSILALILLFTVANALKSGERLQVGIYYDSLSDDSSVFITEKLVPAFADLKDSIKLSFVPLGKSFYIDHFDDNFMCLPGPDDCYGNMIQLCGLHQIPSDEQAQIDFVACEMRRPFNRNAVRPECSEQVGIIWDEVADCLDNGLGKKLMLDARQRSQRIAVPHSAIAPIIIYNGVFDEQLQKRSVQEFATVICQLIDNVHSSCKQTAHSSYFSYFSYVSYLSYFWTNPVFKFI